MDEINGQDSKEAASRQMEWTDLSKDDCPFDREHRQGRLVVESVPDGINVVQLGALDEQDRLEPESLVRRVGQGRGEEGEERRRRGLGAVRLD